MLQSIICLSDGGSTESVGLDDVGSSQQVVLQERGESKRNYQSETDSLDDTSHMYVLCVLIFCAKCLTPLVVTPGQVTL